MDRLDAIAAFVEVAERRGFAPAARHLGVSPSTVTRLVASLEERLSIRVLHRTTRSVTLTAAGERYLVRARRVLADIDEAERAARAERTEPTGRFVVTAPRLFGRREVAPLVCTFLARYPAVRGELRLSDRVVNLVEEGIDVAVRIAHLDDSTLVARRLGATRRVVVASPEYLASHGVPRHPHDLASHAIIHFSADSAPAEWRFEREGRQERFASVPRFATNAADAAIALAERGAGLTMALGYQVADAVASGRLQIVLAAHEPAPLPIQIVYPSARQLSASVRCFVDLAVATCRWSYVKLGTSPAQRTGP